MNSFESRYVEYILLFWGFYDYFMKMYALDDGIVLSVNSVTLFYFYFSNNEMR